MPIIMSRARCACLRNTKLAPNLHILDFLQAVAWHVCGLTSVCDPFIRFVGANRSVSYEQLHMLIHPHDVGGVRPMQQPR